MYVANILTTDEISVPKHFNVVNSIDLIIKGKPTLIVGYDLTEKLFPDFDVLDRKINEDFYWILKRREKRDEFNIGLDWFINEIYKTITKDIHYIFIDPILFGYTKLVKIIKKIKTSNHLISYRHNDMCYLYVDNIIFGINLTMLKFFKFDVEKLIDKIIKKSSHFLNEKDIKDYKEVIQILGYKYMYVPALFYLLG